MDDQANWPVAAASRVRVKVQDDISTSFCRLFYNQSSGLIELVPHNDDDFVSTPQQRIVYDDSNANIEEEPTYQSYITTANDGDKVVVDSFHPDDVIGAHLSLEYNINNPNTFHGMQSYASAKYNIYSYPKKSGCRNKNKREANHKQYTLDPKCCEDFADARLLIQTIQKLAQPSIICNSSNVRRPMNCLVILNPYSGGGGETSKTGAKNIYETMVKPMLDEAGIEHDALVTKHGGHARERMAVRNGKQLDKKNKKSDNNKEEGEADEKGVDDFPNNINADTEMKDISEYDAIIAMGGDGIQFEIFQGIHSRPDEKELMSVMKFGIVPCGTYNGLVKSLLHWSGAEYDILESIFHICKGYTSTLDVATYQVLSTKATSTTSKHVNQSYLSFLSFAWGLIADCDFESECLRWLGPLRSDIWAVYRGVLCRRQYRARFSYLPPSSSVKEGKHRGTQEGVLMPELGQPLPDGWESIEDEFLVFWVCNTSHAAFNMYTCPMAKMNDGLFHVLIVRSSCSRFRLIQMLLKLDSGGHVDCEDCNVIDCVAYQFEPLSEVSYNVLDGELLDDGPIQARFVPGGAQFFVGETQGNRKG